MSNETNFNSFPNKMWRTSFINWIVSLTLKMYGNGMKISWFLVSFLAGLYAGASFQLIMGLMGTSGLFILIRPLIVCVDGFRFTYIHLSRFCTKCEHSFIVFLSCFWNLIVRSLFVLLKLLLWINSLIFSSYEFCEMTRVEFSLSAFEIVALFLSSYSLIWHNNSFFYFCRV